ncbi:hypothetical protein THAOC_00069 [Thalassiosira oceanica]|uniref:Uncharacterized protein n=1 Tax=Thalassiosira oceanica TaxID=159749 RepID=K0TPL8_THAOC|nr:hypothetical protein THAOC_00069 [Thalassiosira oceanica]|eukprot:EJK78056.1 hypothetical protein THAOC_00069 [Thalassiosira oceanica]
MPTARIALLLSLSVLFCSFYGCNGALRQTKRKGCFAGRKILCLHQLLLIAVLVFAFANLEWTTKLHRSVRSFLRDPSQDYNGFEERLSVFFDGEYFKSLCSSNDSTAGDWLEKFVSANCPQQMKPTACALSGRKRDMCDTTCYALQGDTDRFQELGCCPSKELCQSGFESACPYDMCRLEIFHELSKFVGPAKVSAQASVAASGLMIVLSILLICYNPRDSIEIELYKTGVLSIEDLEAVRRLKERSNMSSTVQDTSIGSTADSSWLFGSVAKRRSHRVSPISVRNDA